MKGTMLKTPVLLITFNRPDHTGKVLSAIIEAHPLDLYVFQDGAREGNGKDGFKCAEVRDVIENLIKGTEIRLHTFYSNENLGCGAGPATAINWFFSNVEMGIVMEDDCLPHQDFFSYSEELLERYKDDDKVHFINSTLYNDRWKCRESYGFSHYMVTGAWAGWRRTWQGYDLELKSMDACAFRKLVLRLTDNRAEANWWYSIVKEIQQDQHKKTYWDYQMQIHLFNNSALTIHPKVNLVSNIGFDDAGTHTLDNKDNRGNRMVFSIMPLTHPLGRVVDKDQDAYCWAKTRSEGWLNDIISYMYERLLWSDGFGHKLLMLYKKLKGKGVNTRKL